MFELPRMVIKAGQILVDDTEIRQTVSGKTIVANPNYDQQRDDQIETWFDQHYSLSADSYGVDTTEFPRIDSSSSDSIV
jgi:formylmethanofuran dehydrogenase subunit A